MPFTCKKIALMIIKIIIKKVKILWVLTRFEGIQARQRILSLFPTHSSHFLFIMQSDRSSLIL
jgi:hypothetical protein